MSMSMFEHAVAVVAYELWEASGRAANREIENWLTAERIVCALLERSTIRPRIREFTVFDVSQLTGSAARSAEAAP